MLKDEILKLDFINPDDLISCKAVLKKSTKEIIVYYELSSVLSYDNYINLINNTCEILKPTKLNVFVNVNYQNLSMDNGLLQDYVIKTIKELSKNQPRYNLFNNTFIGIDNDDVSFKVEYDAEGFEELVEGIKNSFLGYGLSNVNFSIIRDENMLIQNRINELNDEIQKQLEEDNKRAFTQNEFNRNEEKNKKKKYVVERPSNVTSICSIPVTQEQLIEYSNNVGIPYFLIQGYIFNIEFKELKNSTLLLIKMTDETDSIIVKSFLRSQEQIQNYKDNLKVDTMISVYGTADYDNYLKTILITSKEIKVIGVHKDDEIIDSAKEKRVELHLHTKMSALDGISEIADYVKITNSWGWRGLALTDSYGVYAIPDMSNAVASLKNDFKPIYGCELDYVDDDRYFITFDKRDIDLKSATYVVYDIETTGFSQTYDRIIEIGAHKVRDGRVIDEFETFVNPNMKIPEAITQLTSITDMDVKNAPAIEEVLPKFLEFCKDSILVAHNAKFDVGMIYANIKRLNIDYPVLPVIDTLNLFRAGYYEYVKTFNLKSLCKYFKVKQEHHHRATDDTRVTAECFILMLNDLYQKNITNYQDINSIINKDEHFKHIITKESHICVLALNKAGNKNMYKLISDALTTHLRNGEAKALKSVIKKYRENILIGSCGVNGEIFNLVFTRSEEEAKEALEFYDYVEVCPPSCYSHLVENYPNGDEIIMDTINRVIKLAKENNKIVVAVSDSYYIKPSEKKYREILINSPKLGGGTHDLARAKNIPDNHLRTTDEMLNEFRFLDPDLAYEIVVENTNKILDMVEKFDVFSKEMFAPRDDQFKDNPLVNNIQSINEESKKIVHEHVLKTYGEKPHQIVVDRIERELNSIITSGYMSVYYISHLLVKKSLDDGYLVGSRGSVGSSLVATMMDITEVNPLKPHYVCKNCKFHTFKMSDEEIDKYGLLDIEKPFQDILRDYDSGFDLPDMNCPVCGTKMDRNGQDIPFETFLGFKGDKTPDIDLNFSGEYQPKAHEYIKNVFGFDNSFRGGTVQTIADKNGYGYVRGFCEKKNISLRDCEIDRLATHLNGIRRSTGQHPGGIVVVPNYVDIFDVTPYQYPADDEESTWRTTHFDYHKFENNLLKFDILGHDDPTVIRFLMNYVNAHQSEFPFDKAQDIPIADPKLYELFNSTEVIGLNKEDLGCAVATYGIPEFGTNFVQNMLIETKPRTFAQLIKISGLSHGTDVWNNNAQELIKGSLEYEPVEFKDIIGCRDDIMVDLMRMGLTPKDSFDIMEFVRKGKRFSGKAEQWENYSKLMMENNVPGWYIYSCSRIKYMFPKAHAIAYVIMALRIAWFKVYYPILFYSAWFSKRAKAFDVKSFLGGPLAIRAKIEELQNIDKKTATIDDQITSLQMALEMTLRGYKFLPVSINKSSATVFEIEDGALRLPFAAVDKLGENVALDIVNRREEKEFTSIKDVENRTKLNSSLVEIFKLMRFFDNLPEIDKVQSDGIFSFLEE